MYRTIIHKLPLLTAVITLIAFAENTIALTGVVYGVRDLGNQFIVRSIDLTDEAFTMDLLTGDQPANQRIRSLFMLPDNRLAILRTKIVKDESKKDRSSIEILGDPVDGILQDPAETIKFKDIPTLLVPSSAVSSNTESSIIAFLGHFTDTQPFSLGNIDIVSNQITALPFKLREQERYGNLTQCSDGITYATNMMQGSGLRLVRLDFERGSVDEVTKLKINGMSMRNDLASMTCSSTGELLALGDPLYRGINTLFKVNQLSGEISFIRLFDVDKVVSP